MNVNNYIACLDYIGIAILAVAFLWLVVTISIIRDRTIKLRDKLNSMRAAPLHTHKFDHLTIENLAHKSDHLTIENLNLPEDYKTALLKATNEARQATAYRAGVKINNATCLLCHQTFTAKVQLSDGEPRPLCPRCQPTSCQDCSGHIPKHQDYLAYGHGPLCYECYVYRVHRDHGNAKPEPPPEAPPAPQTKTYQRCPVCNHACIKLATVDGKPMCGWCAVQNAP